MRRAVVGLLVAALLGVGIAALRAEVMTVDEDLPPGARTDFVIEAQTREDPALLTEMTRGLVSVCRLLVNSDLLESGLRAESDGVYVFSLSPALDEFDVREMTGCLSDTKVQHLLVDVREVETVVP